METDSLNYVTYELLTYATLYVELETFKGNRVFKFLTECINIIVLHSSWPEL
jgi:hypothetical protein